MRRADNLTTFMCRLSWDLVTSNSWNTRGMSRFVQGLLYLVLILAVCHYFNEWFTNWYEILFNEEIKHKPIAMNFDFNFTFWSALQPRIWDNTDTLIKNTDYSTKLPSQNCSGSWLAYWLQLWWYVTLKEFRIDGWDTCMEIVARHENFKFHL